MSPDEVHQMGLEQVDELHGRMDPILEAARLHQGTVGERMQALAKDPRYKFTEGDKGRAEIMAFIQERLKLIRAVLPRAFNTLVPGNLEVRRLPPAEEPGAPGAYGGAGSIDGKIPGKFWINLRTTDLHRKYNLPDLAAHEAIPGHVWQGEYAQQAAADPHSARVQRLFRRLGALCRAAGRRAWGLRRLPRRRGSAISSRIAFRAAGWWSTPAFTPSAGRRQQGVDYLRHSATARTPAKWRARSTAIAAGPARPAATRSAIRRSTACATGPRRRSVRNTTCATFDDAVVLGGNVPMDVLAKNVDDYIARTKSA